MAGHSSRSPLVLLVTSHEWFSRSLETILTPNGYAVLRAYTARSALEQVARTPPDAIILSVDLPQTDGLRLCRQLRSDAHVNPSTPIFLTATEPVTRQRGLEACRAGASELWSPPLDAEVLLVRLGAHLRAKFDADRARAEGLVDSATALYNVHGVRRRIHELGAEARRRRVPLACVVFTLDPEQDAETAAKPDPFLVRHVAHALKALTRSSDTLGRVGSIEFAVVVQTDAQGAARLGHRVAGAVESPGRLPSRAIRLVAGYDAVSDASSAAFDPVTLLGHARRAVRAAARDGAGGRIRQFESGFAHP